jgi:hypothetical protein
MIVRNGLLLAFLASSLSAQITSIPRPALAPETIGDAALRSALLIPPDSVFSIANDRPSMQRLAICWLREREDNTRAPMYYFAIPANSAIAVADFAATQLNEFGSGALVVVAIDSIGNPDPSARIEAGARIGTIAPIRSSRAFVSGLRRVDSEVGIVNLDRVAHAWTVNSGSTITVPPYSVVHTHFNSGATLVLQSDGADFWWGAYGCSVDEATGELSIARASTSN